MNNSSGSSPEQTQVSRIPLTLRLALRDMRGGLAGFRIFLACIALGVMAIVGVGSVSRSLSDGVGRESRRILGGDASFALMHRELGSEERAWLSERANLSTIATMRAMSRREDGTSALVEIKAVDALYPVLGSVELDPPVSLQDALAVRNGIFGLVADAALPVVCLKIQLRQCGRLAALI